MLNEKGMGRNVKISVIIPVYNAEKYLRKCLDSVKEQTLQEIEILCIDDGSTDDTPRILNKYLNKEKRMVVISQQNEGVAIARNIGIDKSVGEFLFFLDADDWLPDANVLSDLYYKAKEQNVFICGGSFLEYGKDGFVSKWESDLRKYTFDEEKVVKFSQYQFDFGWVRFIYNREFIQKNNLKMPPYKFFEDPVFFVKAMHAAGSFYCIKRYTYCYRRNHKPSNLSNEKVVDLLKGLYDNIEFAKNAGYNELLKLEKKRLEGDYAKAILEQLTQDGSYKVIEQLERMNQLIYNGKDRVEYHMTKIYEAELNEVYKSTTWRVGSIVLYIPKKIKCGLKKVIYGKRRK